MRLSGQLQAPAVLLPREQPTPTTAYETGVDIVDSLDVAENIKSLDRVTNRTSIPWFSNQ
jgi:hypothetical protein